MSGFLQTCTAFVLGRASTGAHGAIPLFSIYARVQHLSFVKIIVTR